MVLALPCRPLNGDLDRRGSVLIPFAWFCLCRYPGSEKNTLEGESSLLPLTYETLPKTTVSALRLRTEHLL